MKNRMNPKVFVSHASEDKVRFVLEFATKLRENGIDAWLDRWEMLPGDSLVDKIFEEGVKEATAIIVVISNFSIAKPWVREELNAAFVKRIEKGVKLIPVVIDNCEVPEALKNTLWEKIGNVDSYEESLARIIAAVYGKTHKPPLGSAPKYVEEFTHSIGTLTAIDSLVLRLSCEHARKIGYQFVNSIDVFFKEGVALIPEGELDDSLEILETHGYVKVTRFVGGGPAPFQITTYGFNAYAEACISDYGDRIDSVASAIVNGGLTGNQEIRERLDEEIMIVDHILDVLEVRDFIKLSKTVGGHSRIYNVSPALKRRLAEA